MNRRKFIINAMAAVAASYAGGTFELDHSKLEWKEATCDFGNKYVLAVKYTKSDGEIIRYGIGLPFHPNQVTEKRKEELKQFLLKWLEETV